MKLLISQPKYNQRKSNPNLTEVTYSRKLPTEFSKTKLDFKNPHDITHIPEELKLYTHISQFFENMEETFTSCDDTYFYL